MAAVKLNVLHWHLSEDQGFRVESAATRGCTGWAPTGTTTPRTRSGDRLLRPRPWHPGGARVRHAGSLDQLVRGLSAISPAPRPLRRSNASSACSIRPSIPPARGPTPSSMASSPRWCQLFPDPFWHIGGDEVNGRQWSGNPRIVRFRRAQGLKDNDALQAWFNRRIGRILARHGRRLVGWDEILHPNIPRDAVIQSWRGTEYLGRAASQGNAGILSAPWYLDTSGNGRDSLSRRSPPGRQSAHTGTGGPGAGGRSLHVGGTRVAGDGGLPHLAPDGGGGRTVLVSGVGPGRGRHVSPALAGQRLAGTRRAGTRGPHLSHAPPARGTPRGAATARSALR